MSPVELLLLGLLRYLGHGWTFDDIEEQTAISISVHHNFFHTFIVIEFRSTTLYSVHVITPVHLAEAQSNRQQDFLVVSSQQIALTSQWRDMSTTLKTTISAPRVVILLTRSI